MCQFSDLCEITPDNSIYDKFIIMIRGSYFFMRRCYWRAINLWKKPYKNETDLAEISVGDYVTVISQTAIKNMLNDMAKYKGCRFMDEMYPLCGQTFRVTKRVMYFYDEFKNKMCKCNDMYFLDGAVCSGKNKFYQYPCDLMCYYFWHKDWLRKI